MGHDPDLGRETCMKMRIGKIFRGQSVKLTDNEEDWAGLYCPVHGRVWIRWTSIFKTTLGCPFCNEDDGGVDNELDFEPRGTILIWDERPA